VLATVSSTGFSNVNYLEWPVVTHYLLILLMVMGGSSGSTAGGNKCIRLIAAFKLLQKELKQVVHPHAYLPVKANERSVRSPIASAIWGFLFLYLWVFSVIAFILTANGLDLDTAATATFSALSNIGPAFGSLGPFDNYSELASTSKLALCFGMILGRLEFFTVLVLLTPAYWRK
jgi:trk system potassium uptake protein TrkH